jgi:hypothetical protein
MSNFHESAEEIHVDDGHVLKAVLNNVDGEGCEAEFDLNEIIGNDNGEFVWGGSGMCLHPSAADLDPREINRLPPYEQGTWTQSRIFHLRWRRANQY